MRTITIFGKLPVIITSAAVSVHPELYNTAGSDVLRASTAQERRGIQPLTPQQHLAPVAQSLSYRTTVSLPPYQQFH